MVEEKSLDLPPGAKEDNSPIGNTFKCFICWLSTKDDPDMEFLSAKCGHIACKECWERSLKERKQCPNCRKKLRVRDLNRVF